MKIIVIAGFADSLINFRGVLLAAMANNGHDVIAMAPGENPVVAEKLRKINVVYKSIDLERTGLNPLKDLRSFLLIKAILRDLKPDLLLAYTIKPVIYGSLAARGAGVPHIFSMITGLGYSFIAGGIKQRLVNIIVSRLYKIGLAENEKVFFQNPDDLSFFREHGFLGDCSKAILINGSGVDIDYYTETPPNVDELAFLLVGRLIKDKGIGEFIEAARMLKRKHPQVLFRIVGPLDSNPAAFKPTDITAWQQEGIVEYLGEVDDVRPVIAGSSVYVLPSYREGTPRTVLEAMAMRRPIVTTDAPGCRETVVDGENGFLVPVQDSVALANAMEKFILEPDLIEKMGKRSREIAADKYDVHKVNAIIMQAMGLIDEENV